MRKEEYIKGNRQEVKGENEIGVFIAKTNYCCFYTLIISNLLLLFSLLLLNSLLFLCLPSLPPPPLPPSLFSLISCSHQLLKQITEVELGGGGGGGVGGGGGRKGAEKGASLDSKLRESLTLFRLTTGAVVKVEFSLLSTL